MARKPRKKTALEVLAEVKEADVAWVRERIDRRMELLPAFERDGIHPWWLGTIEGRGAVYFCWTRDGRAVVVTTDRVESEAFHYDRGKAREFVRPIRSCDSLTCLMFDRVLSDLGPLGSHFAKK